MKKTFVYIILVAISFFTIVGCDTKNREIERVVKTLYASPVAMPLDSMVCVQKKSFAVKPKYKMVVYVDSSECVSCSLEHLVWWNSLINETMEKGKNIDYIFIFAPKPEDKDDVCSKVPYYGINGTVYVDSDYVFLSKNQFVLKGKQYRSFLLDEENKIIFIGYPNAGNKSYDLYNKIISKID